jgi:hypothetical protein
MHVTGVTCRGTLTVVSTSERVGGKVRFSDGAGGTLHGFAMTLGSVSTDLVLLSRTNATRGSCSNDIGPGQPPDTVGVALLELLALGGTVYDAGFLALPYTLLGCDRRTRGYLVCTSSPDNRPVWDSIVSSNYPQYVPSAVEVSVGF